MREKVKNKHHPNTWHKTDLFFPCDLKTKTNVNIILCIVSLEISFYGFTLIKGLHRTNIANHNGDENVRRASMAPKRNSSFIQSIGGESHEINSAYQARFPLNSSLQSQFCLESMHVLLLDSKTRLCHHQVQGCAIV
uniref:Uncharacterized protein n=1 Tax=Micrurus lemniscatus lemniscatus TaxID=129467 RepID=A0A2D4HQ65_MICLE